MTPKNINVIPYILRREKDICKRDFKRAMAFACGGSHQARSDRHLKTPPGTRRKNNGHGPQGTLLAVLLQLSIPALHCSPPSPHPANRHAGWDTRPSKVMSYIGFLCTMVAANASFTKGATYRSLSTMGSTSSEVCSSLPVCCQGASWMPLRGLVIFLC